MNYFAMKTFKLEGMLTKYLVMGLEHMCTCKKDIVAWKSLTSMAGKTDKDVEVEKKRKAGKSKSQCMLRQTLGLPTTCPLSKLMSKSTTSRVTFGPLAVSYMKWHH